MATTRRSFLAAAGAAVAAGAVPRPERGRSGPKLYVAAVTPCDIKGRFDEPLYKELLALLNQRGADGVLVLGTTGEFASFSLAERKRIAEAALKHRAGLEMIVQVGTANLPETLDLLAHAAANGADAALCIPPFYFKNPSLEGLVRYYSQVLEAAKIPVHLYHFPAMSAVPVTLELLHRLEHYPALAGIKDSTGNPESYAAYVKEFPKLNMMTGTENNLPAALQAGMGGMLVSGNLFTKLTAAVFAAHREGKDVAAAFTRLREANQLLRGAGVGGAALIKYALTAFGLRESYVRPPQVDLTAEQKAQLKPKLAQVAQLA